MKHPPAVSSFVLAIGLSLACSTPLARSMVGPTEEQAAENRNRPFVEGMAFVQAYRTSTGCGTLDTQGVLMNLAALEGQLKDFRELRSLQSVPMARYESEARARHTELAFEYAKVALEKGCLEDADYMYRHILEFYVGSAYSGIRDRARLGIEDVRARRAMVDGAGSNRQR